MVCGAGGIAGKGVGVGLRGWPEGGIVVLCLSVSLL